MAATTRMPVTTATGFNPYLDRAYAAANPDESRAVYDEWAQKYDSDVNSQGYVAPLLAVQHVLRALNTERLDPNTEVLDPGCGTGLVGAHLKIAGAKNVDGVDYSQGMLDMAARTGAYRSLTTADLTKPIESKDDAYDALVCVGTLTHGHVGPEALNEFVRVVKRGGPIVATVVSAIWEQQGFKAEVEKLVKEGKVELLSANEEDYRPGVGVRAIMLVMRVK